MEYFGKEEITAEKEEKRGAQRFMSEYQNKLGAIILDGYLINFNVPLLKDGLKE